MFPEQTLNAARSQQKQRVILPKILFKEKSSEKHDVSIKQPFFIVHFTIHLLLLLLGGVDDQYNHDESLKTD